MCESVCTVARTCVCVCECEKRGDAQISRLASFVASHRLFRMCSSLTKPRAFFCRFFTIFGVACRGLRTEPLRPLDTRSFFKLPRILTGVKLTLGASVELDKV
jgi:hypothetical protein